jgi:tetratricopeptide (TPR) repeat protein
MNRISTKIVCKGLLMLLALSSPMLASEIQDIYAFTQTPPRIPEKRKQEMDPVSKAYLELGIALQGETKYEQAIETLERVLKKYPESGLANLTIGVCYYYTGYKEEAIKRFQRALNDTELSVDDQFQTNKNLEIIYTQMKDFKQAEVYATKLLELKESPSAYNTLAYLYAVQGIKLDEAMRLVNLGIMKLEDAWDESFLFYLLDTRGWIYYKMGKYNLAEKDILASLAILAKESKENVLLKFTKNSIAEVYYHLGMVYKALGNNYLAKMNLTEAVKLDKGLADAINALKTVN